jgi:uncharacterized membrane protein
MNGNRMTLRRTLFGSAIALAAISLAMVPQAMMSQAGAQNADDAVTFAEIAPIIATRCTVCHSATPTQAGYRSPPNGVMFDTPDEIRARVDMIEVYAVKADSMPFNNETNMTDDERVLLGLWITAGADISN